MEHRLGIRLGYVTHDFLSTNACKPLWPHFTETSNLPLLDFAQKIRGHVLSDRARLSLAAFRHSGSIWLFKRFCIISDRPSVLNVDNQCRLHCDSGAAIEWRDGLKVYYWHGTRIPKQFIENQGETVPDDILKIENQEIRRAAIDAYSHFKGHDALFKDLNAVVIASDECLGQPRTLLEIGGFKYVRVINGTEEVDGSRREFLLEADPESQTPQEAIAASYDLPMDIYKEAVRT